MNDNKDMSLHHANLDLNFRLGGDDATWGDTAKDVFYRAPVAAAVEMVQGVGQLGDHLSGNNFNGSWLYDDVADLLGDDFRVRSRTGAFVQNWVAPTAVSLIPGLGITGAVTGAAKLARTAGWVSRLAQAEGVAAFGASAVQRAGAFVEGVDKAGYALKGGAKVASYLTQSAITNAAFEAIITKDDRPHLGDMVASMTGSQEGIASLMFQSEADDSWVESRFKHAIEGGVLGAAFDGTLMLAKSTLMAGVRTAGYGLGKVDPDLKMSDLDIITRPNVAFERGFISKDLRDKLTNVNWEDPQFAADGPFRAHVLDQVTESYRQLQGLGVEEAGDIADKTILVFDAYAKRMALAQDISLDDAYASLIEKVDSVDGISVGELYQVDSERVLADARAGTTAGKQVKLLNAQESMQDPKKMRTVGGEVVGSVPKNAFPKGHKPMAGQGDAVTKQFYGEGTPEETGWIQEKLTHEAAVALRQPGAAKSIGWYREAVERSVQYAAPHLPELNSSDEYTRTLSRLVFRISLAVASNGNNVVTNYEAAIKGAQATLKRMSEGRDDIFELVAYGKAEDAASTASDRLNAVVKNFQKDGKFDAIGFERWLLDANKMSPAELKAQFDISLAETAGANLVNAHMLGSKIGSFYANLSGAGGHLTMDRWWVRTWNRVAGSLLQPDEYMDDALNKRWTRSTAAAVARKGKSVSEDAEGGESSAGTARTIDDVFDELTEELKTHARLDELKAAMVRDLGITGAIKDEDLPVLYFQWLARKTGFNAVVDIKKLRTDKKYLKLFADKVHAGFGKNSDIVDLITGAPLTPEQLAADYKGKSKKTYWNNNKVATWAKSVDLSSDPEIQEPRGGHERKVMREVAERSLADLKANADKYGFDDDVKAKLADMSLADYQALLWYHEKDLYNAMGVKHNEKLDFADAGIAFNVKTFEGDLGRTKSTLRLDDMSEEDIELLARKAQVNSARVIAFDEMKEADNKNKAAQKSLGEALSARLAARGASNEELEQLGAKYGVAKATTTEYVKLSTHNSPTLNQEAIDLIASIQGTTKVLKLSMGSRGKATSRHSAENVKLKIRAGEGGSTLIKEIDGLEKKIAKKYEEREVDLLTDEGSENFTASDVKYIQDWRKQIATARSELETAVSRGLTISEAELREEAAFNLAVEAHNKLAGKAAKARGAEQLQMVAELESMRSDMLAKLHEIRSERMAVAEQDAVRVDEEFPTEGLEVKAAETSTRYEASLAQARKFAPEGDDASVNEYGREVLKSFEPKNNRQLNQESLGSRINGAVGFTDDGKAVIQIAKTANRSTVIHEMAHVFRRNLEKLDPLMLRKASDIFGVADAKLWSVDAEERFARAFEAYMREGRSPTPELDSVFASFKVWLTEIYRKLVGSPLHNQMNTEVRDFFDAMLGVGWNRADVSAKVPSPRPNNRPVEGARSIRRTFLEKMGIKEVVPHYPHVDVERSKLVGSAFGSMEHNPSNPAVASAYADFKSETRQQYAHIIESGVRVVPWDMPGEPYSSSQAMQDDLVKNNRLYILRTLSPDDGVTYGSSGGDANTADHPMLEKTGIVVKTSSGADYEMTYNDLFRFVHDAFGHATDGHSFSPRGELGAYISHAKTYSLNARRAMATETLGQNAWVNYGPHMLNSDGSAPLKGDPNYIPVKDRRFADQKAGLLPDELIDHPALMTLDQPEKVSSSIKQWLFQGEERGLSNKDAMEEGIGHHINFDKINAGEDVIKALRVVDDLAEEIINRDIGDVLSNDETIELANILLKDPKDVIATMKAMNVDGKKQVARFVAAKRMRNAAALQHVNTSKKIMELNAQGEEVTLFDVAEFEKSHQTVIALDALVSTTQKTAARIVQAGNIVTDDKDALAQALADAITVAAKGTPEDEAAKKALNAAYAAVGTDAKTALEAPPKAQGDTSNATKASKRQPKAPSPAAIKSMQTDLEARKRVMEAKKAEFDALVAKRDALAQEVSKLEEESKLAEMDVSDYKDQKADAQMQAAASDQSRANAEAEAQTAKDAAAQSEASAKAAQQQADAAMDQAKVAAKQSQTASSTLAKNQRLLASMNAKLASVQSQLTAAQNSYGVLLQQLNTAVQGLKGLRQQTPKVQRVLQMAQNIHAAAMMGQYQAARQTAIQQNAAKAGLLDVVLEHGKASILSGIPTLSMAITSNLFNGIALPITRAVGSAVSLDWKEFRKSAGLIAGTVGSGFDMVRLALIAQPGDGPKGFLSVAKVFATEKGTLLDDQLQEAMGATKAKTFGLSDQSVAGKAVNVYGRGVRMPFTAANAIDETYKQIAYLSYIRMKAADAAEAAVWNNNAIPPAMKHQAFNAFVDQYVKDAFDKIGSAAKDPATGRFIHQDAAEYAQSATFQNELVYGFGKSLQELKGKHPLLDLIIPFIKTPTNLIRAAVEMTPVLGQMQARTRKAAYAKAGLHEGKDAVLRSRGLQVMGAAVWASAAYMAASGQITGSGPSNMEERKALMATGWRPYSFLSTDENGKVSYIEFRRFDPLSTILGLAADYSEASAHMHESDRDNFAAKAVRSLAENFLSKTYLVGLTEGLKAITQPDQFGAKYLRQRLASFVPNFLAKGVQSQDDALREPRTVLEAIKARTPLAYQLDPRRNILGEAITPTPGYLPFMDTSVPGAANWISRVASPAAHSYSVNDAVKQEMADLRASFSEPARSIVNIDLTTIRHQSGRSAYDRLRELSGTVKINGMTLSERLNQLVGSDRYQQMPMPTDSGDGMNPRVRMIRRVLAAYQGRARTELMREIPQIVQARRAEFEAARRGASRSEVVRQILNQ